MEAPILSTVEKLTGEAIDLLSELIKTPSFSKEESRTAEILFFYLEKKGIPANKHYNNVWTVNKYFDEKKQSILLNSHHDTVKPNKNYTVDPFGAQISEGKLFGLGSNDAGASLVSLLAVFLHFFDRHDLKYNLVFAASAEEEISGSKGIESLLPVLPKCEFAIVGEPTQMNMAVAEKGLLVLDCCSFGKAGHAARDEGENAIYKSFEDILWFKNYQFSKISPLLGPVKMSVTSIETENKAHNVVPSQCKFVVDIRVNELYTFEEALDIIRQNVNCSIEPRSLRIKPSSISTEHPLVKSGSKLGKQIYGSPTTSDKALMNFPALKMGPGKSERSHTADEFIYLEEIKEGIEIYIELLKDIL